MIIKTGRAGLYLYPGTGNPRKDNRESDTGPVYKVRLCLKLNTYKHKLKKTKTDIKEN